MRFVHRRVAMVAIVTSAVALGGCRKGGTEGGQGKGSAAEGSGAPPASAPDDAQAAEAPEPAAAPGPSWELTSAAIELECGADPQVKGTYGAALAAGRAAGKAKRWAQAVAAFEHALAARAQDPAALDELGVALLQAGNAARALEVGVKAVAAAAAPNAKAAAHYNAGRAAEALGDLAAARAHYEQSLALRPHDGIRDRLAKLAPADPRPLERATAIATCQGLASVEAVCACLAKAPGAEACEPSAHRGERGHVVHVRNAPDEDGHGGAGALVLVARRGATWSALHELETTPSVDGEETPRAAHHASVAAYAERPLGDRTLLWIETTNVYTDTGAGSSDESGAAQLTLCEIAGAPGGAAWCAAPVKLASWSFSTDTGADDEASTCDVRDATVHRAVLSSARILTLILANGVADGRAGRYKL